MPTIFAVVLTFNRKTLLQRCLDAILRQTRPCDRIIVIDNASTDGTAELLQRDWAGRVNTYVLSRNIGASGGFNVGIRTAYQAGADFVWVMDDDVLPDPTALEKLVEADQLLADMGVARSFVLSSAWTEDGSATNVPKIDTRPRARGYENWPMFLALQMVPVTRATFVSILLPRSVIAHYGLPLAPMFIWGEDSEYTLRITNDCQGFFIAESRVLHLRQLSGNVSILTETNQTRLGYHRHHIRNHMYIARVHGTKLHFVRHTIQQLQLILKLIRGAQFKKTKIALTGFLESFWFRPPVEPADGPSGPLGVTIKYVPSGRASGASGMATLGSSAGSAT